MMKFNAKSLGRAIRKVRKARGITRKALAKAAGVSRLGIKNAEDGYIEIYPKTLGKIAKKLDVPVACLTILACKNVGNKNEASEFLDSVKDVISNVLDAIEHLRKKK